MSTMENETPKKNADFDESGRRARFKQLMGRIHG